jgi:two-component system sensor histidine kinase KdpD
MDVDAILRRKPAVCLVDEFAHTNVPGSPRLKRWEDVQVLLQAGIDVFTTLNVQHLESLNDEVWHITGVRVRETVPDWVVDAADEVVLVDLTAEALQNRLHRGVVYTADKAKKAMENFFTEANLTALREMALRHTAHEVEGRLSDLDAPAPGMTPTARPAAEAPARHERILICLTERPSTAVLIRRGKRVADYLHADCLAVHVERNSGRRAGSPQRRARKALELRAQLAYRNARLERQGRGPHHRGFRARAEYHTDLPGAGGRARVLGWGGSTVHKVVRLARDREITVVAERLR